MQHVFTGEELSHFEFVFSTEDPPSLSLILVAPTEELTEKMERLRVDLKEKRCMPMRSVRHLPDGRTPDAFIVRFIRASGND